MNPALLRAGGYGGTAAPNVPSPAIDLLAPCVVTRLIGYPGIEEILWAWDESADIHDGVIAASGLAATAYDLDLDGVVNTHARVTANALAQPTALNVGTASAFSVSQDGQTRVMTVSGTGQDLTSDQLGLEYWTATGNFWITVKNLSAAGAFDDYGGFAGVRAMADSANGNSIMASCHQWLGVLAANRGIEAKGRITTGGSSAYRAHAIGDGSFRGVGLARLAGTLEYWYQNAAGEWQSLYSEPSFLPSTVRIGRHGSSNNNAQTAIITQSNFFYTSGARIEYTQPTTALGVVAKVRARDSATPVNISAYCASITRDSLPDVPPPTGAIKAHFGFWPEADLFLPLVSDTAGWAQIDDFIDTIGPLSGVTGLGFIANWGRLETAFGDYSAGFAAVDQLYSRMAAIGKPFMLHIWDRKFAGGFPDTRHFPQYVLDTPGWIVSDDPTFTDGAYWAAQWLPPVNDREIALYQAYGTRYNGRRWFEGFETAETSVDEFIPTYNSTNAHNEWKRFWTEVAPYWQNSLKLASINFYNPFGPDGVALMYDFIEHVRGLGGGMSGPDMYITEPAPSEGEIAAQGLGDTPAVLGMYGFGGFNTTQYKNLMPMNYHDEYRSSSYSIAQSFNYSRNNIKNNYLTVRVIYDGGSYQNGVPVTSANDFFAYRANVIATGGAESTWTDHSCPPNQFALCSTDYGT